MRKNNYLRYLSVLLVVLCLGCSFLDNPNGKTINAEESYLRWVGDIEHNAAIDDADFRTCNGDENVIQYFNTGNGPVYPGGKPAIVRNFKSEYKPVLDDSQNGLIRIRFIVNCEGRAGRFRILQSDVNFKSTEFDKRIVSQLIDITSEIEAWAILHQDDQPRDYYYYLLFKIVNGEISEILP